MFSGKGGSRTGQGEAEQGGGRGKGLSQSHRALELGYHAEKPWLEHGSRAFLHELLVRGWL